MEYKLPNMLESPLTDLYTHRMKDGRMERSINNRKHSGHVRISCCEIAEIFNILLPCCPDDFSNPPEERRRVSKVPSKLELRKYDYIVYK